MFDASAEFYDSIYATFKDYAEESARVGNFIRSIDPQHRMLLDVACGTGEHARQLARAGFAVDGVDLQPAFVRTAQAKNPTGRFVEGDMRQFDLSRRYDVVMCLFSSIGYVRTLEGVASTLQCFMRHLQPGGTVLVEPWFEPGVLDPDRIDRRTCEVNGTRVTRIGRIQVEQCVSRLHFDYEIADAGGIRHLHEVHELGLFTRDELLRAFHGAGFDVSYDPMGLSNRGLYIARAH